MILHVRDVSHDDAQAQLHDVEKVLGELGIEASSGADEAHGEGGDVVRNRGSARNGSARKQMLIEVWNKIDRLDARAREQLQNIAARRPERERPALRVLAENIPGVKAVEDHLCWVEPMSGWVIEPRADDSQPVANG